MFMLTPSGIRRTSFNLKNFYVTTLNMLILTVVLNHRKMDVVGMNFQILFQLEISLLHVGTMQITQR